MKRMKTAIWTIILCISLIVLLLMFPQVAHEGADLGVALFMEALFPYLLPYLILTNWFIRLTAQPAKTASYFLFFKTYLISAVGGFPTGAATIAHLSKQGQLTPKQAAYLLGICHSPSPLFVFGFVGHDLFQSTTIAWNYLLLVHAFSLIILTLSYFYLPKANFTAQPFKKDTEPFTNSIKDSVPTVLIVAATIVFFTTVYSVFLHSTDSLFKTLPEYFHLAVAGLLEMTNGLFLLHNVLTGNTLLLATVALLTTQSLSIHLQVIVIARSAKIAIRPYIWIRLLYSIVIPILFFLIFL
ncbi:hypothetical protein [Solibacillus sp. R5-41]|uniref:hypothetical protein n=1 Tax=Solibacillus sp. R5-41 TaxID=2048654 RepID=UPI0012FD9F46|nr:hypothetical protein [Solibacillus sp. R5-41]